MGDKGFDQFTTGAAESFGATKFCRVRFHEIWVKVVLTNDQAELIPEPGLPVPGTVARGVGGMRPGQRRGNIGRSRRT